MVGKHLGETIQLEGCPQTGKFKYQHAGCTPIYMASMEVIALL